jgi:hypothetical protein
MRYGASLKSIAQTVPGKGSDVRHVGSTAQEGRAVSTNERATPETTSVSEVAGLASGGASANDAAATVVAVAVAVAGGVGDW